MNVIVEGFDASGKSTLIKELSVMLNMSVRAAGPPPDNERHALHCCIAQLNTDNTIWDRATYISDLCYRLDSTKEYKDRLKSHIITAKRTSAFIWCIGEGDHIVKPYDSIVHLSKIERNKPTILKNYIEVFSQFDHFRYDFKLNSTKEVLDYVIARCGEISG